MMSVTENRIPLINLFNHISIQAVFLLGQEKNRIWGPALRIMQYFVPLGWL